MLTHADAKEKESDPPDGALRRPPDPGALLHAGQVAGADAPDVLFIAVERVPDAMVMAMERCAAQGLTNVFFIDANADQLPLFFAPGEADRVYINFCDPWPSNRHAKRRLTHGNFLRLYRKVLKEGEQVVLGANDQYIGLCRRHWMAGDLGPDFNGQGTGD